MADIIVNLKITNY